MFIKEYSSIKLELALACIRLLLKFMGQCYCKIPLLNLAPALHTANYGLIDDYHSAFPKNSLKQTEKKGHSNTQSI